MEINSSIIKDLRQTKGWTQQHFADASGLSLRTIQRVERDGSAAKETALAICATLEIELKQLSIIPVVDASQLQEANIYKQLLPIVGALLLGALGGGLMTYWVMG
jgi:transcriptional regulator with XRE-family HTH domain